ncbi:flippase [Halobacteria archaeon AArc-m2/3/4]|uniref:Flippase n=1 Tax=Natronoglomus mannanivorans TaxID=2979990 RepID=A0ABT2QKB1_9EURY|nr:flippase [Halobacteria archaeon AArc-m2/3/4]
MRRDLVTSITAEFGGRVFHAVIAGVLLVFLTRTLGAETYGIFALAVSICAFSRLFSELGIAPSAARYVAGFKDTQPGAASIVVRESLTFAVVAAVTVSLLLVVSADWIGALLDEPALSGVILVGAGYVAFYSLHRYNRTLLQGFEKVAGSAKLHVMEAIFTGLCVIVVVLYEPSAMAAMFGYTVGFGAVALVGLYLVNVAHKPANTTSLSRSEIRLQILKYNVPLSVTRLSNEIDRQVDILLVGYLLNPLAVAFYMIGKEISRLIGVPAASIGFALSPTYGAIKATGNVDRAASIYEESLNNVLIFYIPACLGIALIAETMILNVFGDEYVGAITVVQILSLFIFFEGLAYISSEALDYLGRARTRALIYSIAAVSNFCLNLVLIPMIGVEGAAIATVITHGTYSLLTVYLVYTELSFSFSTVRRNFVRVLTVSLLMGVAVYILLQLSTGFTALLLGIGVGGGIWIVGCHALDLFDYKQLIAMVRG